MGLLRRFARRENGGRAAGTWSQTLFPATTLFFFISGACGLLYQVVWTRKLVLLLGTTSYAVSTVLTIFFIGLGAGSIWGGRLADRTARPLFVYGLFEILIGLWAVLFILLIGWGEGAVVAVLQAFSFARGTSIALRALLALAFLIVPVVLMGATLPLLAKFVSRDDGLRGFRIGSLYAANTFGAVAGCACTGFLLLSRFGYTRTTLIGAVANGIVGILAIALARSAAQPRTPVQREAPDMEDIPRGYTSSQLVVLSAFAVSGFCALALEVLWTRLLAILFLGTTFAFTTMLTTLLCGIAAGSAVASAIADRSRHHVSLFGIIEMLIGISCLLMLSSFAGLPEKLQELQLEAGFRWGEVVRAKFFLSFTVLFAPTFLFGMTFPLVVKAVTTARGKLGRDVGRLYSANTFGGVLGALAGGYILIPYLGTHRGIATLACILFGVGCALVLACPTRRLAHKAAAVALGACLMVASVRAAPGDVSRAFSESHVPDGDRVIYYREGVEGTVAISEPAENPTCSDRVLWINAVQATASIEKGVKMNRFQGVLPMLFDRDPRLALFMCFGSGITAGALGLFDFERIDAVEISRAVLDAAPLFEKDNFDVINNPKVNLIVDDGRNFLLTTKNSYDVISFEPMPLALAGVSTFYTQEYYQLCLERLAPGGIVSQWIPLHSLGPGVVRSLMHTFTSVFPEYCAWFINADLFMVGSNAPLRIDYRRASERLANPGVRAALQEVGLGDIPEVISCFFMAKGNIDAYAKGGTVMRDDRPWAEFVAPKLVHERTVDKTLEEITPYFESPLHLLTLDGFPEAEAQAVKERIERRHRAKAEDLKGLRLYYGGTFGAEPEEFFKKSLEIDPLNYNAQYYLKEIAIARAQIFVRWDQVDKALEALRDALEYAPDVPELHLALADICYDHAQFGEARKHYEQYLTLGGAEARAFERKRIHR